jgi:hypothetical protein
MIKTRAWLAIAHHTAFRCGGWAYVTTSGGALVGAVGGERRVTRARTAMLGVEAALRSLAAQGAAAQDATIYTLDAELITLAPVLATPQSPLPPAVQALRDTYAGDDATLWTQISKAMTTSKAALRPFEPPTGPMADFIAAWAELAQDKAKATGTFTAAIPKNNLSKLKEPT